MRTFKLCILGIALFLSGCDLDVALVSSPETIATHTSMRKIARGIGAAREMYNEDPSRRDAKRAMVEMVVASSGVDMDHTILEVLQSNQRYKNITVLSLSRDPSVIAATLNFSFDIVPITPAQHRFSFDLDDGYHVQFDVFNERAITLGFFIVARLPMLDLESIRITREDQTLPLGGFDLFVQIFSRDETLLKKTVDEYWQKMLAKKAAEQELLQQKALEVEAQDKKLAEQSDMCAQKADEKLIEIKKNMPFLDESSTKASLVNACMSQLQNEETHNP
jgi:hypothetical protein